MTCAFLETTGLSQRTHRPSLPWTLMFLPFIGFIKTFRCPLSNTCVWGQSSDQWTQTSASCPPLTWTRNVRTTLRWEQHWGLRRTCWILRRPDWTQQTVLESHTWLCGCWNTPGEEVEVRTHIVQKPYDCDECGTRVWYKRSPTLLAWSISCRRCWWGVLHW